MNEHLNDDELQQYAIKADELNRFALNHIAGCELCRIKAQQYAYITEGLRHLPKMTVDIDLAALVLPARKKSFSWAGITIAALVLTGLLVIGAGAAVLDPDIRALLRAGTALPLYLLPALAMILLVTGAAFYYGQYKQQLANISHLN